ncbi:hypothetical protein B0H11DRAFT_262041 [Mycena galericulata]|nr:hypothetical protein B0H11DRAFT_262041 [Mycena galericulata]
MIFNKKLANLQPLLGRSRIQSTTFSPCLILSYLCLSLSTVPIRLDFFHHRRPDHLPTHWQCSTRRMAPHFFVILRALCRPHAPVLPLSLSLSLSPSLEASLRASRPSTRTADLISNPPFISLHKPAHVPSDVRLPRTPCRCPRCQVRILPSPELFDATISGRYPGHGTSPRQCPRRRLSHRDRRHQNATNNTSRSAPPAFIHSLLCGVASPDGRRAMRDYLPAVLVARRFVSVLV